MQLGIIITEHLLAMIAAPTRWVKNRACEEGVILHVVKKPAQSAGNRRSYMSSLLTVADLIMRSHAYRNCSVSSLKRHREQTDG